MSDSRPPTRSRRRTRAEQAEFYEHLVQTSLQLFFDGGYEALSMRRLASEVGVAPMSLYRYFPTKAHLVRHLWDDLLGRADARALHALEDAPEPLQRLRCYLDGYLQYWLDNPSHYWVVFSLRDTLSDPRTEEPAGAVGPNPQRFLRTLEHLCAACAPPGDARPGHVELLFCKVLGFLLSTLGLAALRGHDVPALKERLLDDMVHQVRGAAPR